MRPRWLVLLYLTATTMATATNAFETDLAEHVLEKRVAGVKTGRLRKTIYKGRKAKGGDFPFQVYLRSFLADGEKEFCGGAIIGPRHILSAAHCVKTKNIQKVCSYVGHENRFHAKMQRFTVVRQHFYNKRPSEKVTADIVVLMVDRPMPVGRANVQQIRLVGKTVVKPNTTCSISGWGKTDNDDDDTNVLRHAKVPLVPQHLCRKAYSESPPDDLLCAGFYDTGGADTCKGDSGGPLVCNGVLTGIVKSGKGCGLPNYPGTYTDVRYYWNWIKGKMAADGLRQNRYNTRYTNKC